MVSLLFVCSFACFSFSCAGSPSLVHCTETSFCSVLFVLPVFGLCLCLVCGFLFWDWEGLIFFVAYVFVLSVGFCFGIGRVYFLGGGEVQSLCEVGVLVNPPFRWTHPFGDG